jgi:hypothetical protein
MQHHTDKFNLEPNFSDDDAFRTYLEQLRKEFEVFLSDKLSKRTIHKHSVIIGLLIDFLCFDCDLHSLDDLTVGMVNIQFRRWHISKIGDAQESEIKTAVKKFFMLLEQEKGFSNKKSWIALKNNIFYSEK